MLTYTISYENEGDGTAKDVTIEDEIPVYTSYVSGSADATGGVFDETKVTWHIDTLLPGAKGSVTFKVKVD